MSSGTCRDCGTAIPADSPGGFCASCLLALGLEPAGESVISEPVISNHERGATPLTEKPGDRIGRYKLLQEIGHGGCGVVYMAEQEEPVRRKVALKVIKLGMDTKQVVARFDAERQALALMDHSNIAKVLDAGATDLGRPYFVMELVGGIKITDYCDQNDLATRQRLDLFTQVCRAIQHAHQKGVIHRDLKPSNILVAIQDGVPVPKVIDFGIAKATQGRLTDQTVFTAFEQFLGTPAYMSPEQAQLGGMDVDTRSDIYSLGVLLYELLTGTTPFDTKKLVAAGLDEMRRTIREVEPVKPSTRLTQTAKSESRKPKSEKSAVRNPQSAIPSDLDWIVMKCLEKDRARRYETANGLASDVQRHLNYEPVLARPPSKLYEFQKTVRRHKFGFAAMTAIILVLAVGGAISAWQAIRATRAEREQKRLRQEAETARVNEARERERAQTEAAKSQQVAQFLADMLEGAGPSKALGRDTKMLEEILGQTAQRLNKLQGQPAVEADVRTTLGDVYYDLGDYESAVTMHEKALALRKEIFGNDNADVARSLCGLAESLRKRYYADKSSRYMEAGPMFQEAAAIQRRLFGQQNLELAKSLYGLAMWHKVLGNRAEPESFFREALAIQRKMLGNQSAEVAWTLDQLSYVVEPPEANRVAREALAIRRELYPRAHPDLAHSLLNLGRRLWSGGSDVEEGEKLVREALAVRKQVLPPDHLEIQITLGAIADLLIKSGRLREAEDIYRQRLEIHQRFQSWDDPARDSTLEVLSSLLQRQGKEAEIEPLYRDEIESRKNTRGGGHASIAQPSFHAAEVLVEIGKSNSAAAFYRDVVDLGRKNPDMDQSLPLKAMSRLRDIYRSQTNLAEIKALDLQHADLLAQATARLLNQTNFVHAEPLARECLALREKNIPDDWLTFNTKHMLGASLLGQKKHPDAEPWLLSGYEGMEQRKEKMSIPDLQRLKETVLRLINLYETTDRPELAAQWKTNLTKWYRVRLVRFRQAAETGDPLPLNNLAWLMATCEDPAVRDGANAVVYAEKAVGATSRTNSGYLDTLAAAYAENGQFAKAVSAQREACAIIQAEPWKTDFAARLRLYESNVPYREIEALRVRQSARNPLPSYSFPIRPQHCPGNLVDLSAVYNTTLSVYGLDSLTPGIQTLGGVQFDVRGIVGLSCSNPDMAEDYPTKVSGIRLGRRCQALHFLHAAAWAETRGTTIGEYVIRFADDRQIQVPVLYSENILSWLCTPVEVSLLRPATRSVWRGENLTSRQYGMEIHFCDFRWQNPHPENEIESIDFESKLTLSGPILLAITAED